MNKKIERLSLLKTGIHNKDLSFIDSLNDLKILYINKEYSELFNHRNIEVKYDLLADLLEHEI